MTHDTARAATADGHAPCAPCAPCDELLYAAHVAVLRALEFAGKRMVPRSQRGDAPAGPVWERHTVMPVELAELDRLLAGGWDLLAVAVPARPDLVASMDAYARELLYTGTRHTLEGLRTHLRRVGILPAAEPEGQAAAQAEVSP